MKQASTQFVWGGRIKLVSAHLLKNHSVVSGAVLPLHHHLPPSLSVVAVALPNFLVKATFPVANSVRLRVAVAAAVAADVFVSLHGCLPFGWGDI